MIMSITPKYYDIVENRLVHQSVSAIKTMDELVDQVLSGLNCCCRRGGRDCFYSGCAKLSGTYAKGARYGKGCSWITGMDLLRILLLILH